MVPRLPSINSLIQESVQAFKRFPAVLISAIASTAIAIYLTGLDYMQMQEINYLYKLLVSLHLAAVLFLGITLFSENHYRKWADKWILHTLGLILVAVFFISFPENDNKFYLKYAFFITAAHLLVAFAPFALQKQTFAFWQLNKDLFIRFITAVIYSVVLYVGLVLALYAVDVLFEVKINPEWYFRIWILVTGIFNTWFFLAGIPSDFNSLEQNKEYPKYLKILCQYILLPLVFLYSIILYFYLFKILFLFDMPKGVVSYLITGYSVSGILLVLLIHPLKEEIETKWAKWFNRYFFITLVPLIILFLTAIIRRISEYGITENRYILFVTAIWLAGITIYYLKNSVRNIKIIPVSLAIIIVFISTGPWSALKVSKKSQLNRLEKLLIEENILQDGKIQKKEPILRDKSAAEISSIVRYLDGLHGYKEIYPWFHTNLDSLLNLEKADIYSYKPSIVLSEMGVENVHRYYDDHEDEHADEKNYFSINLHPGATFNVSGYDHFAQFNLYQYHTSHNQHPLYIQYLQDTIELKYDLKKDEYVFNRKGQELIGFSLGGFLERLKEASQNDLYQYKDYKPSELSLYKENDNISIRIYFSSLHGDRDLKDGEIVLNSVSGYILFTLK
jgi:hypothetical protein